MKVSSVGVQMNNTRYIIVDSLGKLYGIIIELNGIVGIMCGCGESPSYGKTIREPPQ